MDHTGLTDRPRQEGLTVVPTPIIEVLRHRQGISLILDILARLEALLRTCLDSTCQRQTLRGRNRHRRPRSQLMLRGHTRIARPMLLATIKAAVATRTRPLPPKRMPA